MELKSLTEVVNIAKEQKTRRIAVAAAADKPVLQAVKNAMEEDIVIPLLTGSKADIERIAKEIDFDLSNVEVIDAKTPAEAAVKAVALVRNGEADIMMKGLISTGPLLKAVLDKEKGLRKGGTISHLAIYETPHYHKLLGITDAGMNVEPDFETKVDIVKNAVEGFNKLGIKNPKVAVLSAVEVVNPKMESTMHAALLTQMNRRKQIKNCIIDGPFALDNAVSKEAAEHKGLESDVAGDCDIMLTPDIAAGNILYKSMGFLGGGLGAAVIMGAKVPIVLTSRADTDKSKMMSIALAAAME